MDAPRIILPLGALVGSGLVATGLQKPLVDVPVVGTLMFAEHAPGGGTTVWVLVAIMVFASILLTNKRAKWIRNGGLIAVLASGVLVGLLVSIYQRNMAQVMEIADLGNGQIDEGVKKLIEQMQYGPGAYMSAGGLLILSCVSLFSVFRRDPVAR